MSCFFVSQLCKLLLDEPEEANKLSRLRDAIPCMVNAGVNGLRRLLGIFQELIKSLAKSSPQHAYHGSIVQLGNRALV